MIKSSDAVAYRRDDLGVRMAEHRAHLARGEVQHAPASFIVEKRALGPNRQEIENPRRSKRYARPFSLFAWSSVRRRNKGRSASDGAEDCVAASETMYFASDAVAFGDICAVGLEQKRRCRATQSRSENCHVLIRITQVSTSTSTLPARAVRRFRTKSRSARSRCFLSNRRARNGDGAATSQKCVSR